jgi:hypothetical protein
MVPHPVLKRLFLQYKTNKPTISKEYRRSNHYIIESELRLVIL